MTSLIASHSYLRLPQCLHASRYLHPGMFTIGCFVSVLISKQLQQNEIRDLEHRIDAPLVCKRSGAETLAKTCSWTHLPFLLLRKGFAIAQT